MLTPDTLADDNDKETAEAMVTPGLKSEAKQSTVHYRGRIRITDMDFRNVPASFVLMPGLRLVGSIKIGQRSVLGYILNPITRAITDSLHEP
jgi:HlyD family secretion protein